MGYGVVGAGALKDGEGAAVICAEPDPAAAEEADAFGFEFGFEGVDGAPLLSNLRSECAGRFMSCLVCGSEL